MQERKRYEGFGNRIFSPHELTPYERNTRKHAPEDIGQIKASIEADGFNDPIGIWGEKNIIVEGHGRRIAAIEMGIDRVPCIRLDHLTDEQRRDYAIRHNFTAEQSEFDFERLREEVSALELQGLDMSYLSSLAAELDAMGKEAAETPVVEDEPPVVEDEPPEPPKEPVSKLGDIYQLGRHRLMCGDSTKLDDVKTLMDGQLADQLVTDPPYNVDYEGGTAIMACEQNGRTCFTMELDPRYVDAIITRWETFTGEKAVLLNA